MCLDCWKRYECKLDIQLNLWQYWTCATVERDENVKRDHIIEFVTMWIYVTVEWDYTVEADNTADYVTLLNRLGLLNEIWPWN